MASSNKTFPDGAQRFWTPARIALTTVAQPRDTLARLGISTIADRIERKLKGPPKRTLVEVNLVARRSTAPPRPA